MLGAMSSSARPSCTAKKIARLLLLADRVPGIREVLPAQFAADVEPVLRASGAFRSFEIDAMQRPSALHFHAWTERLFGRGHLLWFALRKRWIADRAEAAIASGVRQVVVVGAGFDPLATAIAHRHPAVSCIEVDAPGTAVPKRTGIERAGRSVANLEVVAADLSQVALIEVLRAHGWDASQPSFVAAEGLLMYLRPDAVEAFFRGLATLPDGSRLAFTSVFADANGGPRLGTLDGVTRFVLRLAGEPMTWGIEPTDVPSFLARVGWAVAAQPTSDDLRHTYLDPLGLHAEPLIPYEHLVLAEPRREPTNA